MDTRLMTLRLTVFQSTLSARRATHGLLLFPPDISISIHALREEGDLRGLPASGRSSYFNPRPPRGGRLRGYAPSGRYCSFQSTPSARRATKPVLRAARVTVISIHALREESDAPAPRLRHKVDISIHALREESDCWQKTRRLSSGNFNPRSPWGERRQVEALEHIVHLISIHALREEGDSKSGEKIHHVCSIIHACAQFEKELYKGSGKIQNKSC